MRKKAHNGLFALLYAFLPVPKRSFFNVFNGCCTKMQPGTIAGASAKTSV